jgi:hypothetical protein
MTSKTTSRSWEWSPSPSMNAIIAALLRTPLLHRLVSKRLLLLSFAGRKSGHHYDIPVGYSRQGKTIIILTKRFRLWWRNFRETTPINVWLEGKLVHGRAIALLDEATITPIIVDEMIKHPDNAEFFGVNFLSPNSPDPEAIRRIAPNTVVLRITLTA